MVVGTRAEEQKMNEDRVAGTAKNIGGQMEEGFGRVTGYYKALA